MNDKNIPVLGTFRDARAAIGYIKYTLFEKARAAGEEHQRAMRDPDCKQSNVWRFMGYSDALRDLIYFYQLDEEYHDYLERIEKK